MSFYNKLQELSLNLSEQFSDDGNEGYPGYSISSLNEISRNYPWIYIDFELKGRIPLLNIIKMEKEFQSLCCEYEASYLECTINNGLLRFKLLYRGM